MWALCNRRWLSLLVACVALAWSYPSAEAMTLSGLSSTSRQLTQWLKRSSKYNEKLVHEAISLLADQKELTKSAVKKALDALSKDAKNVHEHLSQLDSISRRLMKELEEAMSNLKADGPSLDDVANKKTRCPAIDDLRKANQSYGEAVDTVKRISQIIPEIKARVKKLEHILQEQIKYQGKLQSALAGTVLGWEAGLAWADSVGETTHREINARLSRAEKKVSVLPELLRRRKNYDARMKDFIDPLLESSCLREDTLSSYDEAAANRDDGMESYDAQTDAIRQREESAATTRQQRIKEAERAHIARNAALEAERNRLRNEYAQARQRGDGGTSFWSTLSDALALSAGVATGMMQAQTAYSGSDRRCEQARAQVHRYDRQLNQMQNPSHSTSYHQQARQQVQHGRNQNLRWVQNNC